MPTANALSQSVVVIGLNAAFQKRFVLPPKTNLIPGNVHRAHDCETGVGGKGQDVGVAMSCLMSSVKDGDDDGSKKVLLAQFLGKGAEGDAVSDLLRTKFGLVDDELTIRNAAPLRTCTTIVGADEATELVETSGEVTNEEMATLQTKVEEMTSAGGKADCVCIMGSMPPGCPDDTYADLVLRLAGKQSLVLIDSVIGLDSLLGALSSIYGEYGDASTDEQGVGGAVLKLNAAELCKLADVTKGSGGEADQVTMEELAASAKGFVKKHPHAVLALDYLCVTDGKFPGYLVELPPKKDSDDANNYRTWQLPAVDLSNKGMLYPIGAGDTVAAGTLAAWQYLHHHHYSKTINTDQGFFGVIPSKIGTHLSNRKTEWLSSGEGGEEDNSEGYKMATAFAFGLACGSASCLQQENSVFEVDDAVKFFEGMANPVIQ
eukprot:CAMPEP_0183708712 /NCGR_PEP_ID=MMETSP0737-20130205/4931_1 /TAXON_ID=385413 /ORGANISM="Thalassiosira miniscula, Strain CCMP1093" /LENGTH=431 /DNA_ID=CAMNT_0025936625 /DNA_START=135 /DNA_END=1430 /DNA_ORIENTATION=-